MATMSTLGFGLQVGALPRLCDVLQVLQEERAQCLQELSRERKGDLSMELPVPGMRPTSGHVHVDHVQFPLGWGACPQGQGEGDRSSFAHSISWDTWYYMDPETSTSTPPFSGLWGQAVFSNHQFLCMCIAKV